MVIDKIDSLGKEDTDSPGNSLDIMKAINGMRQHENNILIFGISEDVSSLKDFFLDAVSVIKPDQDLNSTLPNKLDVPVLVKNSKHLQSTEKYKGIYIRPDQTAMQRDHYLNLRKELNQLNDAGEGEYAIKYKNGFPSIIKRNA
ncbi:hypothetical protein JTB14_001529 [Gonioctena quinquepunctata]|nr:hypothetical protein JTB14_001529 [Gonioctena quinquepunctata]